MPNDALGKYYPPITPAPTPAPDELADEVVQEQLQEQEQESKPGWQWVGDERRPEAKESSDGISDLFAVSDEDVLDDVEELVEVDMDRDVIDAGEDGTLGDLVNVTEEDIMGSGEYNQPAPKRYRVAKRGTTRQPPPTSVGGLR